MKTNIVSADLESQAAEALRTLLAQVSGVKIIEIKCDSQIRSRAAIFVDVDVYGHSHTLACRVRTPRNAGQMRLALREAQEAAADHGNATPVLIAPYLSPEAQGLCKEARAGFLDLEGNARLSLGEVFIGMRSLPCRSAERPAAPLPVLSSHLSSQLTGAAPLQPFPIERPKVDRAPVAMIA